MTVALILVITAISAYLLGCCNGAILVSKRLFHEDIRDKGSGNAGLTNFYRIYGARSIGAMLAVDVLKTALAIVLGWFLFSRYLQKPELGQYWAALFVVLGHCFPCFFAFKGGKGILCSGTMLIMLDWRIAVVGFGLFILTLVLTRYVSLGSILAAASFPFTTYWVYHGNPDFLWLILIAVFMASFVIFAHRSNIRKLVTGTENQFRFRKSGEGK